jgi:hypothetical protein
MTPEKQRIAIAEARGHKILELEVHPAISYQWVLVDGERYIIDDYINDLNAMHEAEKLFMPPEQKSRWLDILSSVVIGRDIEWEDYHCFPEVAQATAAQRAEAFLRTLGKWEESA